MPSKFTGLAAYLYQEKLLDSKQLHTALDKAKQLALPFISYLVREKLLTSDIILSCIQKYIQIPLADPSSINEEMLQHPIISREFIRRYHLIPFQQHHHILYVAISDPTDNTGLAAIGFQTGLHIQPQLIPEDTLSQLIDTHFKPASLQDYLENTLTTLAKEKGSADEPVSHFLNHLLLEAVEKNISDIHIEPFEKDCRIRFRRDGLLYESIRIPTSLSIRIITRLKILAELNIAEHRLPQDGRIQMNGLNKVDIRLNSCPMLHGEKMVLRLLNNHSELLDIHSLGMSSTQTTQMIDSLQKPQGLILVTGPTGSGKTMTLYAALHFLNHTHRNISSAEDPIEIEFPGINQIQVNSKIGLDFPTILRAFLRQDPDIIMIGEIRDKETAQMAIQAAQTGHLVLSTLHTNNAAETIIRLQSMNIEPYHLASSLSLIIAQRLIRKLCQHCKMPDPFSKNTFQAVGCKYCHQGYHQRSGIFECIPITRALSDLILSGANVNVLIHKMKELGNIFLHDAGIEAVQSGKTSYAELARVTGSE